MRWLALTWVKIDRRGISADAAATAAKPGLVSGLRGGRKYRGRMKLCAGSSGAVIRTVNVVQNFDMRGTTATSRRSARQVAQGLGQMMASLS
jgi:hypothetical protein